MICVEVDVAAALLANHDQQEDVMQERSQGDSRCASEKLGVPHLLSD